MRRYDRFIQNRKIILTGIERILLEKSGIFFFVFSSLFSIIQRVIFYVFRTCLSIPNIDLETGIRSSASLILLRFSEMPWSQIVSVMPISFMERGERGKLRAHEYSRKASTVRISRTEIHVMHVNTVRRSIMERCSTVSRSTPRAIRV